MRFASITGSARLAVVVTHVGNRLLVVASLVQLTGTKPHHKVQHVFTCHLMTISVISLVYAAMHRHRAFECSFVHISHCVY